MYLVFLLVNVFVFVLVDEPGFAKLYLLMRMVWCLSRYLVMFLSKHLSLSSNIFSLLKPL